MKNFLLSFAILSLFASNQLLFGQTTEMFETETHNTTTFTDNSQVFNITSQAMGPFHIQANYPGFGFNGTTGDNVFIDNDPNAVGGFPIGFTIESSGDVPFIVNNFWIYLGDEFANIAVSGTLTLVGKLGGVTVYSVSQSSGFNQSAGVNNGFSQINMSTFGSQNNANKPIDELVITTANNFNYAALDAFNWTVTAPEANIKGNSVSIVDGDASPTTTDHSDFSSQSVCSGTVVRTYTVENTGTRAMTISSVNISGTHSADFTVTSSPASTVAAGGSTTFQVTFNPSATGTRSATITVNCSDANEAAYDFAIQGTGQDPEVNVQGNSTTIADGDVTPTTTDHTDFGSQSICSGTVVRTFTIQNTGNSNLTVGTVTIGGTHASDFTVTATPSSPVSAAGSTTFQVTFNPSASGTRSADITFTTNDCDESTYNFNIQGTGQDPEVNVQGNSNSITDGDATPSTTDHTDFGSQSVCSGTIVRTFTIQNTGSSNLTLGTVTIGGTHASDFSVTASPSSPVSAAGSTTFQVTFNPSASGTRSADISFTTNDCDEATYNFNIQGTGQDPEVNVQGNSNSITDGDATPSTTDHTDFGSQSVCSGTIVRTFTIQNTGNSNLTLGTVTIGGTNAGDFSVTASPSSPVSAAGSTTFQVTFNPSASGTRSADISFTTDDCDESTYNFNIQGTGTDPEINVQGNSNSIADGDATPSSTDHTDFGSQDMCTGTVVRTFTIQNTGNSNLTLGTVTIGGTHASDFSVTATPSSPVSAAGSTTFQVTFDPSASGTRSADISFTTNDCDETTYNFNIQGTGTDGTPSITGTTPASVCDGGTNVDLFATASSGTLNWYDASSGGTFQGTGSPLTVASVSSTTTLYVDATVGSCTSARTAVTLTVNTSPVADAPSNVTACDSYTLPALTVGNYFSGAGGTGTAYSAGNVISSSMTMYVYAETGTTPNCTDENSFTVTINTTPVADAPSNVTACDSYTLPALTVGDYFSGTGGTGTAYSAGNVISSSMTMYVYAETGTTPNCSDENSFTITINTTPVADAPSNVTACDSYTLPALTVGNYFTGTGGTGTALSAGNAITSTQTIYVYAETGTTPNCTDENSFTVTINTTPAADAPSNVTACDSYTLPALTVGNYFTGTGGTGTALSAGNVITSTQTIYVYAETGTTPNCTDENSFTVTINTTPVADAPSNVTACDSYTLPALTVGNYFSGSGGTGTAYSAGNVISSSMTMYVYAETGTTPNCTDENSFTVTINTTPVADDPSDVTACGSYTLPALTLGNYFTGTSGTGTALSAGNVITTSQTIFVYAETGTTPNCSDENSFTVTITPDAHLRSYDCGRTSMDFSEKIYADVVPGATDYRFEVFDGTTTVEIDRTARYFYLTQIPGNDYNKTYTIRVKPRVGGVWGCYGASCNVMTARPRTKVAASQCGVTLPTIETRIFAETRADATAYRFRVSIGGSGVQTIDKSENAFRLTELPSYNYNTTYTVHVAYEADGVFGLYGAACTVTTPSVPPLTEIQASQCGTTLATTTAADKIYANHVYLATDYRFEVTYGGNTQVIDRTIRYFFITQYSGWQYNRTYSIRVASKVNGTWTSYGPACNVTTPASGMKQDETIHEASGDLLTDISVEAYPNPNSGSFTVNSTHEGVFNIINELGQLIQRVEFTNENNRKVKIENLQQGVYFITGAVNNELITKKVVVVK